MTLLEQNELERRGGSTTARVEKLTEQSKQKVELQHAFKLSSYIYGYGGRGVLSSSHTP